MSIPDRFIETILQNISDGVYICDPQRRISYWSPSAERITGYAAGDVLGSSCSEGILMHVDETGASLCTTGCPITATLSDSAPREMQVYLHHRQGHRIPVLVRTVPVSDGSGEITGVVELFSDNSILIEMLRRVQELSAESETDPLTGIANRRRMETALELSVSERRRSEHPAGLLFIDIDHFKSINDTFGHDEGDRVLKMVASTLKHNVRTSDVPARWGGEEFVVLLQHVDAPGLVSIAEKLRVLVSESFLRTEDGEDLRVTVSLGGTLIRPSDTVESVLSRADRLLYESKAKGRNRLTWSV